MLLVFILYSLSAMPINMGMDMAASEICVIQSETMYILDCFHLTIVPKPTHVYPDSIEEI